MTRYASLPGLWLLQVEVSHSVSRLKFELPSSPRPSMSKDTQASQTFQEAPANTSKSQWLFPLEALQSTPSTSSLEKQLYDRARGVEFLYRLGSSLQLSELFLNFGAVLTRSQASTGNVHCRNMVPQVLHALLHG